MARHDQQAERQHMICMNCRADDCNNCVDVLRMVYTDVAICRCGRASHGGEPARKQILDPETGTVHGPGFTVDQDGKVQFDERTLKEIKWRFGQRTEQFDGD